MHDFPAPQAHFGFAIGNNVTLLASGHNNLPTGSLGSGIYAGKDQEVHGLAYDRHPPSQRYASLVVRDDKIHFEDYEGQKTNSVPYLKEDLRRYSFLFLLPEANNAHLTSINPENSDKVICKVEYSQEFAQRYTSFNFTLKFNLLKFLSILKS